MPSLIIITLSLLLQVVTCNATTLDAHYEAALDDVTRLKVRATSLVENDLKLSTSDEKIVFKTIAKSLRDTIKWAHNSWTQYSEKESNLLMRQRGAQGREVISRKHAISLLKEAALKIRSEDGDNKLIKYFLIENLDTSVSKVYDAAQLELHLTLNDLISASAITKQRYPVSEGVITTAQQEAAFAWDSDRPLKAISTLHEALMKVKDTVAAFKQQNRERKQWDESHLATTARHNVSPILWSTMFEERGDSTFGKDIQSYPDWMKTAKGF